MVDTYLIDEDLDLVRQQGDTAAIEFLSYIDEGIDLTGYTIKFKAFKSGVAVIDKSTDDDIVVTEITDSSLVLEGFDIYIPLDASDTKDLTGSLKYEIEVSKDVGLETESIITIGKGTITMVKLRITNPTS